MENQEGEKPGLTWFPFTVAPGLHVGVGGECITGLFHPYGMVAHDGPIEVRHPTNLPHMQIHHSG